MRGGRRYVNRLRYLYNRYRAQYKKKPTPAGKKLVRTYRWRYTTAVRYFRSRNVRRIRRVIRRGRPVRRYSRRCGSFKHVFRKQFRQMSIARRNMYRVRGAAREARYIAYLKIRAEIYGWRIARSQQNVVTRYTRYNKRRPSPVYAKTIAKYTARYNAIKAHLRTAAVRRTRAGLMRLVRSRGGCRRVRKVRVFRGRPVRRGRVVRRVCRRAYRRRYIRRVRIIRRSIKRTKNIKRKTALRTRIIRIRVIKGGMRYIRRCRYRLRRYIRIYRRTKKAIIRRRIIVLKKRIAIATRIYRSRAVRRIRRKVTRRRVVRRNTIRFTRRVVRKNIRRKYIRLIRVCLRKIKRANPKHRRILRQRIIRYRTILRGRRYVRRCGYRLRRYRRIYKKKPTPVIRRKILICRGRYRRVRRVYRRVRRLRRGVVKTRTYRVRFGRRVYRRIRIIRRRIYRTRRIYRRVKNPTPTVKRIYRRKIHRLTVIYRKLIRIGRKSCNVNQNMRDVRKSSASVSRSLRQVLRLTRRAAKQAPAAAAKTQSKIADLLKQNIKYSSAISEKMKKSTQQCPCQNCGNCPQGKTRMVQTTEPAKNATATAMATPAQNVTLQFEEAMY